jgi:hypothetical protein
VVDRESLHGLVAGTHLVVSRRGYRHHGIYVGQGRVIHYAGPFLYPRGCVEEIALAQFADGRPVSVGDAPDWRCAEDIVRRARSRLGECRYDLLSNNCEHFCSWCELGEARSSQVESLKTPAYLIVLVAAALTSALPVSKWSRARRQRDSAAAADNIPKIVNRRNLAALNEGVTLS